MKLKIKINTNLFKGIPFVFSINAFFVNRGMIFIFTMLFLSVVQFEFVLFGFNPSETKLPSCSRRVLAHFAHLSFKWAKFEVVYQ